MSRKVSTSLIKLFGEKNILNINLFARDIRNRMKQKNFIFIGRTFYLQSK